MNDIVVPWNRTAMQCASFDQNAAIRAIRGESDPNVFFLQPGDESMARVIAFASEAHPTVRAVAALQSGLTVLLDPLAVADPALHAVMARMIETRTGHVVIWRWAEVAPAGWGRAHAAALVNAVKNASCAVSVAAALIGPCDEASRMICTTSAASFAIRRWGQSSPDTPNGWADALSSRERNRLVRMVRRDPSDVARCLPWLPPEAGITVSRIEHGIGTALLAFAEASPSARALHADLLRRLIAQARPSHLGALTRLACAMGDEKVWVRVRDLVQERPSEAYRIVAAAPWDDLPEDMRNAAAELHPAIGAAQGRRVGMPRNISEKTAVAFFAALVPRVWDETPPDMQRRWRQALKGEHAHLAVRSLGLRTEILGQTQLTNHLITSARRHICDAAALRWTLLPIALRDLLSDEMHAVIAALPTPPPNPDVFFTIASGRANPPTIECRGALRRKPDDLACIVVLQRCARRNEPISVRCTALQHALRRRSWDDLAPIMEILDADVRNALLPDPDALVERLAHPTQEAALRKALGRLSSLPPEIAIPASVALKEWTPWNGSDAAAAIAHALHAYGDVFLAIADALADADHHVAFLPTPNNASLANALRVLAYDDPPSAQRCAHAFWMHDLRAALYALLEAPLHHAVAVWQTLDANVRREIGVAIAAASHVVDHRDPDDENADPRDAGFAALAAHSDFLRVIWSSLPQEAQQSLRAHPDLADLSLTSNPSAARRWRS